MDKDKKTFGEQLGEYLIDISKLTFGGVVLSLIIDLSHNKPLMLLFGAASTFGIALWGFLLINYKNKKS